MRILTQYAPLPLIVIGIVASASLADDETARPNILFIMTDQQPVSTIGQYGNPLAKTPNIDRLAQEGMRFDGFHIAAFACSPSRACFWTGQYSHHHGVTQNDIVLSEDLATLGTLFGRAGYQSAFVGKWHLGGQMYVRKEADKWSYTRADDPERFVYTKDGPWRGGEDRPQNGFVDKWIGGWSDYHQYLRGVGLGQYTEGNRMIGNHSIASSGPEGTHIYSMIPEEHHISAFLAGEAEKFICTERDPQKPFCLVLSFYGPHLPVAPPQPWDSMFKAEDVPLPENHQDDLSGKPWSQQTNNRCYRGDQWSELQFLDYVARYWGYCSYIDQQVGRVLEAIDDRGLAENTIVVFTADHGDMVAAHGFVFKLVSGYDELMRVPLIVRYPKVVKPGQSNAALVESIDVLPTLLDLAGLEVPREVDGHSFRTLLQGSVDHFRDAVVTIMPNTMMIRDLDWKLVFTESSRTDGFVELYDLRNSPLEIDNLAPDPVRAGVLKEMKGKLRDWLQRTGYPYAKAVSAKLDTARTGYPSPDELITPSVASFEQAEDRAGNQVARFAIEWQVGCELSDSVEYWTFVQAIKPGGGKIASRATRWPDTPTTEWTVRKRRSIGPMDVPILADMKGEYTIRVGLYSPKTGTRPDTFDGAQRNLGTLTVKREAGQKPTLAFTPKL